VATISEILSRLLANPGLALVATLLLLCIIMVFPVVAAFRRKAREQERERERARRRPQRRSLEPREPHFGPAPYRDDDDDDDEEDEEDHRYRRSGFGSGPPRRGKSLPAGALAKFAWFALGVAVGAGLMAMNDSTLTLSSLLNMPIESGPGETAESRPPPAAAPRQDPAPAPARKQDSRVAAEEDPVRIAEQALAKLPDTAPQPAPQAAADPVDTEVAEFVSGLRARLPMPIGRDIELVNVNAAERVITLSFAIQLAIPESDYPNLQKTLDERFRNGICSGQDELGIRKLNEAGVSFSVRYSDLVGKTVARLEMLPNFCKGTG
jgi:hypothetical protein